MQLRRLRGALIGATLLAACAGAPAATAPSAPTRYPPATAQAIGPAPTLAVPAPATPTFAPTPTPADRYDLVLLGGTLIDGSGAAPLPDTVVAIRAGRIAAVAPRG